MEDIFLGDILDKMWGVIDERTILPGQTNAIIELVKKYGDYRFDAGVDWANDQAHYSWDEA